MKGCEGVCVGGGGGSYTGPPPASFFVFSDRRRPMLLPPSRPSSQSGFERGCEHDTTCAGSYTQAPPVIFRVFVSSTSHVFHTLPPLIQIRIRTRV